MKEQLESNYSPSSEAGQSTISPMDSDHSKPSSSSSQGSQGAVVKIPPVSAAVDTHEPSPRPATEREKALV